MKQRYYKIADFINRFKIGRFLIDNFEEFTCPFVSTLAACGIICAIIGHYGTMGFDWKWFIFFEFPLFLFCGWALYKAYKIYKYLGKNKK